MHSRSVIRLLQSGARLALSLLLGLAGMAAMAQPAAGAEAGARSFRFEDVESLDQMRALLRERFPLGTERAALRDWFVRQGHATLKLLPTSTNVEKYIYDIDLCHYYVWRWNISADYDEGQRLLQVYLNGEPVHPGGTPKKVVPKVALPGRTASIYRSVRPRPEAFKGETQLVYLLFDRDSDPATKDDQALIGAGPSRPDPVNMGAMVTYVDVEPWRSIFDSDSAESIAPYSRDCRLVDVEISRKSKASQAR